MSKPREGARKPRRKRRVGTGERVASGIVLVLLGAIAVAVFLRQFDFNPAVEVSLREGALSGRLQEQSGPNPPTDPSPAGVAALLGNEFPLIAPASPIETFGPENLSDKIDGKAELYLPSGFKAMACRAFTLPDSGARLEIYLYEMETAQGAFAVLSGQRRSGGQPVDFVKEGYSTENALFFASGNFYAELIADRGLESVTQGLVMVGKSLLALLPAQTEEAAGEASLFPKKGLVEESIRLTATDGFGLEALDNIFTADYRLDSGEASAFLSLRTDPGEAAKLAHAYLKFLKENDYKEVDEAAQAPAGAVVLGLDGSYEVVMTQDRLLAGVHEATSLEAALDLARDVAAGLQGKGK